MPASDHYSESADGRFVTLRNGISLPVEPCRLALNLEAQGFRLWRDGDDLIIEPGSRLSSDDAGRLRRWKRHLLALLDVVADVH